MPWKVAAIFQQNPSSGILMTAQPHIWDAKKRWWAPHMLCLSVCWLHILAAKMLWYFTVFYAASESCCCLEQWTETHPGHRIFLYYALPKNIGRLLHLHPLLVESWWSEWIVMAALLLLLFMMKVNVWHFNPHKVIRPHVVISALIVMLLSKCLVLEIFVQTCME
jgi:hypothetical protein